METARYTRLLPLLLPMLVGCPIGSPAPRTVAGRESPEVARGLTGALLSEGQDGTVRLLDLRTWRATTIRARTALNDPVLRTAGPGAHGEAALIVEHTGSHSLVMPHPDLGSETTILNRQGSALWDDVLGAIALTPGGNRIALVSHLQRRQMQNPPALLMTGEVEVLDLATRKSRVVARDVLEDSLCWYPDGRRLAVSRLVAGALPAELVTDGFGEGFARWEAVPVTSVVDTVTGKERPIHVGWDPVVSTDGKRVLVSDYDSRWCLAETAGGAAQAVALPGSWGSATALLADGRVIYRAYPTAGTRTGYTRFNSPLVGPKQLLTVKVGRLSTGQFCTIVADVDPRMCLSYGPTYSSRRGQGPSR